jgi:hypothetical protein
MRNKTTGQTVGIAESLGPTPLTRFSFLTDVRSGRSP